MITRAKISPRAIRYEFRPGEEPRLVLEPWEEVIPFKGAEHHYAEPRTIRVWGRRKLRLLEKVLPFADRVSIYLKGRALPTFYVVHLPGMEFILGLSGWSARQWSEPGGHALLGGSGMLPDADVAPLRDLLAHRTTLDLEEAAGELGADKARVAAAFSQLCRHGSALYDLDRRAYRHRELFVDPPDFAALFPPDVRSERAAELLAAGDVDVGSCTVEENRKKRRFKTPDGPVYREVIFRDWKVNGRAGDCDAEVIIDDRGKIIFGTCQCPFFRDHLLNQGPCEHLLALFEASAGQRVDGPNSREAAAPPKRDRGFGPGGEVEGEEEDFDEEDNLEKESN